MRADFRSLQVFGGLVAEWWRESVDYTGYVQYFAKRSMAGAIRLLIGVGIGVIAVIAMAVLFPAAQQTSRAAEIVVILFVAMTAAWSGVWCVRPWPTRHRSRAFIISADVGIAALALIGSTWLMGLFALNCFALISVYLMFFDGPRALALHTVLISLTAIVFIALMSANGAAGDSIFAGRVLGAMIPVTITPLGIQFGIRTLRNDANESATDPLTGLLNRRGLHLHFDEVLQRGESVRSQTAVVVIVVDLDRFKDVNDTYGHAAGDEVLIRCARRITAAVGDSALVARAGGEEFVIVDLADPCDAAALAEQTRRAITAPGDHPAVTASLGVTSMSRTRFTAPDADTEHLLAALVARADQAMFEAKHHGGNTIHHG